MRSPCFLLLGFLILVQPADASAEVHGKVTAMGSAAGHRSPSPLSTSIRMNIRALFALQDAAAQGNPQSPAIQKPMLTQIAAQLLKAGEEDTVWLANDIAGFVLSGGNPRVAERAAQFPSLGERQRRLLGGAARFMQGDTVRALADWKGLDVAELAPATAGRFALARAILAKADGAESERWLEQAIALMPGTLVEESALRRSALGFGDGSANDRLWRRAERYLRRFPRSLYAQDFVRDLAARLVFIEVKNIAVDRDRLDRFAVLLPHGQRRPFFLSLSRSAAAASLRDLTLFAARRLERLAEPRSAEGEMAILYKSLFALAGDGWEEAYGRLARIEVEQLPRLERALLAASLEVARQMAAPLPPIGEAAPDTPHDDGGGEYVSKVRTALAAADKAMGEAE